MPLSPRTARAIQAAEELLSGGERETVSAVLGRPDAPARDLERAIAVLDRAGVRAAVELHLRSLLDAALRSLEQAPLAEPGVSMLRDLASALALRDR